MNGFKQMEIEYAIDQMKKMAPYLIEVSTEMSKVTKSYYDGLIEQGFDEKQALKMSVQYTLGFLGLNGK